ncbi:hypothetical protein BDW59DRAFT_155374 [Aspergillus cavernicola]|uniref:Aminoglycoside phosphotransferase domain-containing protein n=1 Tax=Aspergillus cavernicola TaxID=176166 RepID=A0ABR4HA63_9EURO
MEEPVRESIKQVDANTWLIGGLLTLHRSSGYSDPSTWYDHSDNFSYTITNASVPPPSTVPLSADDPTFKLVYDAGDSSAVWSLGNSAFCKVKVCVDGTTPEAATLAYVHERRPSFELPTVLHQAEFNGRSYLFLSRVLSRTLAKAWPNLDEKWKHHYVSAVASICKSLEAWKSDTLGGVDGKNVPEQYLIKDGAVENYDPQNLLKGCKLMGMDCSEFAFYHADLGPGNIVVEDIPKNGTIGIIDWEVAGFFPKGWIRTKFRISSGLNLPDSVTDNQHWWRWEVQKSLEELGFQDYSSEWMSWWY